MLDRLGIQLAEERQRRIYRGLFARHHDTHKSLHWSSVKSQEARFQVLTRVGNLQSRKVLDVGCGMGDFYVHLRKQGHNVRYIGLDIVDEFIQVARERHPGGDFRTENLLTSKRTYRVDYVFSSGLFAFGNRTFFNAMIQRGFRTASAAYAFNLYTAVHDREFFSISLKEAYKACKALKPKNIEMAEGYLENDVTFFLYK